MELKTPKKIRIALALAIALGPFWGTQAWARFHNAPYRAAAEYVPGEVIVKFKPATTLVQKAQKVSSHGHVKLKTLNDENTWHVKLGNNESVAQGLADYKSDSSVEYVQPNYIYHIESVTVPNDPLFPQQWSLQNTGQTVPATNSFDPIDPNDNPGTSGDDIGVTSAWNLVTDCSKIIVAVVDTGINYNHQDLAANIWKGLPGLYPNGGYDFVTNTNNPMDQNGHGTHVSGTIGAVGNNGIGTSGICWKVQLMAVRVLDRTGSGTTANIALGINFAVTNGANVINMSLGGSSNDPTMLAALGNAQNHGVIVVVAAGNSATDNDTTPTYPCSYGLPNMICVAALDQKFQLATFSNYGPTSVNVGAPGTNILSTWAGTQASTTDTFNTGGVLNWTAASSTKTGWGYQKITLEANNTPTPFDMLSDPANWDGVTKTYKPNTNDTAFKTFSVPNTVVSATLDFQAFVDLTLNKDFFNIYYDAAGGSPFAAGTEVASYTGPGGNSSTAYLSNDITACASPTCSIGLQLTSGAAPLTGVGIIDFAITTLTLDDIHYNVIEGTSMATPHVTGLAALIWAYNPSYTYADVVNSVKNGGTPIASLAGKTTSGNGINAMGSLSYIQAPTGVTASMQ